MAICQDRGGRIIYTISHNDALQMVRLLHSWGSPICPRSLHLAYYYLNLGHDCGHEGNIFFWPEEG